uniref:Ig-like domain-containing protein n=1 Tax=Rhabditophanes sp. KR3021 TaxID=114890 RepID=A0AC35TWW2_9BILA
MNDLYYSGELLELLSDSVPIEDVKPTINVTSDEIKDFIESREHLECIISVRSMLVAQKSYQNEKRFLCPPPTIELLNDEGWTNFAAKFASQLRRGNIIYAGGDNNQNNEFLKSVEETYYQEATEFTGVAYFAQNKQGPVFRIIFGGPTKIGILKHLFITDASKCRRTQVAADMRFCCGQFIGSFKSGVLNVISKPSKKVCRLSKQCQFVNIKSGFDIALFSRMRTMMSQCKYVDFVGGDFVASTEKWGCLEIYLVDEEYVDVDPSKFQYKEGILHYGDIVKIVASESGVSLPEVKILKAGKNIVDDACLADRLEPICQMHKVCFQLTSDRTKFLSLESNLVNISNAIPQEDGTLKVGIFNIFQIVTVIDNKSTFYCSRDVPALGVTPLPRIKDIIKVGAGPSFRLEITGENFSPNLTFWFGDFRVETMHKSNQLITATLTEKEFNHAAFRAREKDRCVYISRDDGVIYPSDFILEM